MSKQATINRMVKNDQGHSFDVFETALFEALDLHNSEEKRMYINGIRAFKSLHNVPPRKAPKQSTNPLLKESKWNR